MRVWIWFLLMGLAVEAHAGWTYLGTLDGDTVLIDKSTLVQKKHNATIWMLTNYGSPTIQEVLSVSKWVEIDCDKNKYRYLAVYGYEGQMQTGAKLIHNPTTSEWGRIEYGSIFKSIQNHACLRYPLIRSPK
jgi:outer membrane protein assembly factor BamB